MTANLIGADLYGASLRNANLGGADLTGARVDYSTVVALAPEGWEVDDSGRIVSTEVPA